MLKKAIPLIAEFQPRLKASWATGVLIDFLRPFLRQQFGSFGS